MLVGEDGRARVMDFGLARADTEADYASVSDAERALDPASVTESTSARLTETGMLLGTPAYMAPEQHRGEPADAISDQFSFCVALWEAVHGTRPFAGETYAELSLAVTSGRLGNPGRNPAPEALRRALGRGLAAAPSDRFPNLEALITEIELAARPRGRWPWIAGIGIAMVAFGVPLVVSRLQADGAGPSPEPPPCAPFEQLVAGVADEPTYARLRARGEDMPYAPHVTPWLEAGIDELKAWSDRLRETHDQACAAKSDADEPTRIRGTLELACLEENAENVRVLTTSLIGLDGQTPRRDGHASDRCRAAVSDRRVLQRVTVA